MIFDVTIVGAGPAGSFLAYLLANAGFSVLLIDKNPFPRNKVCAGGLPAGKLNILPQDIEPIIHCKIRNVAITDKTKNRFRRSFDKDLVYIIERRVFDHFLVSEAIKAGAEFYSPEEVKKIKFDKQFHKLFTINREINTRIIVGADGANSYVAKAANLNPIDHIHIGLQVEVPYKDTKGITLDDYFDLIHIDWGYIKNGYGWVFPKRDRLSIGVQGLISDGKKLRRYLAQFASMIIGKSTNLETFELGGHIIPHRTSERSISCEGVILVGDAAGMADYWTGEGIYNALKSSEIAADCIRKYFLGEVTDLKGYENTINQLLLPDLRTSYLFSQVFNYLSPLALELIKEFDYPSDVFFRTMRGERSFLDIKKRLRPDILIGKLLSKRGRSK